MAKKQVTRKDLDISGTMFGIIFEPRVDLGINIGTLVHLYSYDDGTYYLKDSFDAYWLQNLIAVLVKTEIELAAISK